jgi:hypothetical protein
MNKNVLPVLLAGLVCAAVVIAEEQRIGKLKGQLAVMELASTKAQEEMDKATADLKRMRERDEALAQEAEQLRGRLAQAKGAAAEAPGAVGASADTPPLKEESKGGGWMKSVAKMFKDPKMKEVMRNQQSMGIRMMYGDLSKELGLSQAQTDKVMELLLDRQMGASEKAMDAVDGAQSDPAKMEQAGADADKTVANYDEQLKALLGPEGMTKLNEYERTAGDRMAIQQFTNSFNSAGQPLDDNQRAGLLQIMKEERMKTPAGPLEPGNKNVSAAMRSMQTGEGLEQALENQRQLQQRVYARAHTVLTPDQMITLESAQKQQIQMQEMGVKMSKAMFGGGDKEK